MLLLLLGANRGRSVDLARDSSWRRVWKGGAAKESIANVDDTVGVGDESVE